METNPTYYIDLVTRYFFGEATPGEIRELEEWVKADPANADLFSQYRKTWETVENARIDSSIDLDHEWSNLKSEIRNPKSEIRNPKSEIISWFFRIAAIFILLAVPTFFLYRYLTLPSEKQLTANTEMVEQTLPDGTIVTLNVGSTLSYPSRFEGSLRKVVLQGEGWFEVAHDKAKPFIVQSENVRIRVVGTSFFVDTKTLDDSKEIILSSGIVKVYFDDKPETMALLFPGDKAEMITNGHSIVKTTNGDVNFLAWKTKHIVFDNTPLDEVAALLSKVYRTNISLSGEQLGNCRITATFDKQSLEPILNVLKATLDLRVRSTGEGFELSGGGCNQSE